MKTNRCFFCDKDGLYDTDPGSESKFFHVYGYIKHIVGKIGNKWICGECKEELGDLLASQLEIVDDAMSIMEKELLEGGLT